jgi:hypothetical protein
MIVTLKTQRLQTLEPIRDFLAGAAPLSFTAPQREAAYGFVADQLRRFGYPRLGKAWCGFTCARSPASRGRR